MVAGSMLDEVSSVGTRPTSSMFVSIPAINPSVGDVKLADPREGGYCFARSAVGVLESGS